MWKRLLELINSKDPQERAAIIGGTLLIVILTLWVIHRDSPETAPGAETELGTVIPKGFLIVPLQLANTNSLAALITHNAVVDVFKPGQEIALVSNLRVMKLFAGEGPMFGALVPEKAAGELQDALANPKLTAALRTTESGPTQFHIQSHARPLLMEFPVGGD